MRVRGYEGDWGGSCASKREAKSLVGRERDSGSRSATEGLRGRKIGLIL